MPGTMTVPLSNQVSLLFVTIILVTYHLGDSHIIQECVRDLILMRVCSSGTGLVFQGEDDSSKYLTEICWLRFGFWPKIPNQVFTLSGVGERVSFWLSSWRGSGKQREYHLNWASLSRAKHSMDHSLVPNLLNTYIYSIIAITGKFRLIPEQVKCVNHQAPKVACVPKFSRINHLKPIHIIYPIPRFENPAPSWEWEGRAVFRPMPIRLEKQKKRRQYRCLSHERSKSCFWNQFDLGGGTGKARIRRRVTFPRPTSEFRSIVLHSTAVLCGTLGST